MKQFNLEEYLKNPNKKVVTRDGRDVRIICTDVLGNYPIVALIKSQNTEAVLTYTLNGQYDIREKGCCDLYFAPTEKEGWINIYKNNRTGLDIFETKQEAFDNRNRLLYANTIKIEWED